MAGARQEGRKALPLRWDLFDVGVHRRLARIGIREVKLFTPIYCFMSFKMEYFELSGAKQQFEKIYIFSDILFFIAVI